MKTVLKIVDKIAETVAKKKVASVAIAAAVTALAGWAIDPALIAVIAEVVSALI